MATDYSLKLKAELDVSDVEKKLAQLNAGSTGTIGNSSTGDALNQSIKNLDNSLKQLNQQSSQLTSSFRQSGNAIGSLARKALLFAAGNIIQSKGGAGQSSNLIGSMMQGAAIGGQLTHNNPFGFAAGALAGMVKEAKDSQDALNRLAQAANDAATAQHKNFQEWYNKTYKEESLPQYIDPNTESGKALLALRKRLEEGQADWQTDKEYKAEVEGLRERYQWLKREEEATKRLEQETPELLEARKQEEEMLQKQIQEQKDLQAAFQQRQAAEEAISKESGGLLEEMQKSTSSKEFAKSIENMTVGELLKQQNSLKSQAQQLETSAMSKAASARDLGDENLLDEAKNEWERAQEARSRLEAVTGALEKASSFNLKDLVQRPAGSMQATGYSTLGSIGFDTFRETKQLQERTAQNTQKTADAVSQMKTDVMEIKTKLQNSPGGSVYT